MIPTPTKRTSDYAKSASFHKRKSLPYHAAGEALRPKRSNSDKHH